MPWAILFLCLPAALIGLAALAYDMVMAAEQGYMWPLLTVVVLFWVLWVWSGQA